MKNYKKIQLFEHEVSEKAFKLYSDSSFEIYKYVDEDIYLVAVNKFDRPQEVGTLKDVDKYLLSWVDIFLDTDI